jgi:cysteine-rich repeat protein
LKSSVASRLVRTFLTTAFTGCLLLSPSAAWAICGDGDVEETEECDDANSIDDDCCSNDCKAAEVESFCTDGNDCTFDFCDGSGFCSSFPNQQAECDDGNACTVGDF